MVLRGHANAVHTVAISPLAALAYKMEPQAAAEIVQGLAQAMEKPQETDVYRLQHLVNALAALANKMEPQAAAEITRTRSFGSLVRRRIEP
jgi:hypothetical protein